MFPRDLGSARLSFLLPASSLLPSLLFCGNAELMQAGLLTKESDAEKHRKARKEKSKDISPPVEEDVEDVEEVVLVDLAGLAATVSS